MNKKHEIFLSNCYWLDGRVLNIEWNFLHHDFDWFIKYLSRDSSFVSMYDYLAYSSQTHFSAWIDGRNKFPTEKRLLKIRKHIPKVLLPENFIQQKTPPEIVLN